MENLALGKMPLELGWVAAEEATNGVVLGYTGESGFAHKVWPCTYTIDLGRDAKISCVRFLLWDGMGEGASEPNPRKYEFTVAVSNDNQKYTTIFSNRNIGANSGWIHLDFCNEMVFRFVKLNCLRNNLNEEFHIVEFQVYDEPPQKIRTSNSHFFDLTCETQNEKFTEQVFEAFLQKQGQNLLKLQEKAALIDSKIFDSTNALELIKNSTDFETESGRNNNAANKWLVVSAIVFLSIVALILYFLFCDTHCKDMITEYYADPPLKSYIPFFIGAYYATKAVFISTVVFVFSWCLKNYRAAKHNYTINKHKAMSLTVASSILTKSDFSNANRDAIFTKAMDVIFSHQSSGYTEAENSNSSIINNLLPLKSE